MGGIERAARAVADSVETVDVVVDTGGTDDCSDGVAEIDDDGLASSAIELEPRCRCRRASTVCSVLLMRASICCSIHRVIAMAEEGAEEEDDGDGGDEGEEDEDDGMQVCVACTLLDIVASTCEDTARDPARASAVSTSHVLSSVSSPSTKAIFCSGSVVILASTSRAVHSVIVIIAMQK
eukprot:m.201216 g.201216  ORF g.201216 m.201216 type:complete len:180 (-) comp16863_c0_seq1:89-628(-)